MRAIVGPLAALLLLSAGCARAPSALARFSTSSVAAMAKSVAMVSGVATMPDTLPPASAGALVDNGAAVISSHGGAYISDSGGTVVSNNGGMAISNGGAHYGLLDVNEKPLDGFAVEVFDALGAPVLDAGGKPYVALTDAHGHYSFGAAPRGHNLVLGIDLPAGLGRMLALLPDAPEGQARNVAVDGVGTHVLGFVLAQYVQGHQDALDRLGAADETDAIAKANAALAAKTDGKLTADTLAADHLVKTVGVWRGLSADFDHQIQTIQHQVTGT